MYIGGRTAITITSSTMAQTTVFYLPDERGNTAMRLDRNGTILSAHVTDAFGATKTRDYVGSSSDDPFAGFGGSLGYMRESGLDLYRCGLRFYDVTNARWLTRDPIGYDGGQILFGICGTVWNCPSSRRVTGAGSGNCAERYEPGFPWMRFPQGSIPSFEAFCIFDSDSHCEILS